MSQLNLSNGATRDFLNALLLFNLFALAIMVARFLLAGNYDYWFLVWNLFLAWVPLVSAWFLYNRTSKYGLTWSKANIALFVVWLLFLPNAFYIFTDFIHLYRYGGVPLMYDIVLISTYSLIGMILGFISLIMVHKRALKRFGTAGHWLPVAALLASGFAIYLGRELRWNSWDVIFNPFGILFDVSERFLNPSEHTLTFVTTLLFFGFLGLTYLVVWRAVNLIAARQHK
jgi:uncharacterized membrane protein